MIIIPKLEECQMRPNQYIADVIKWKKMGNHVFATYSGRIKKKEFQVTIVWNSVKHQKQEIVVLAHMDTGVVTHVVPVPHAVTMAKVLTTAVSRYGITFITKANKLRPPRRKIENGQLPAISKVRKEAADRAAQKDRELGTNDDSDDYLTARKARLARRAKKNELYQQLKARAEAGERLTHSEMHSCGQGNYFKLNSIMIRVNDRKVRAKNGGKFVLPPIKSLADV